MRRHRRPVFLACSLLDPNSVNQRNRCRVLLAEDDYEMREGIARLLGLGGYQVHEVTSGAELMECLTPWLLGEEEEPPTDVIITDVRMPGFDGLNLVEGLRANGWQHPLIVISAFGDRAMRERVEDLGCAAFFDKPFDIEELERTLAELVTLLAPPPA